MLITSVLTVLCIILEWNYWETCN